MDRLTELLFRRHVLVADGAMGTLLQQQAATRGIAPPIRPDSIMLQSPDLVEEIHRRYVDAGADVLLTNTFASSRSQLRKSGSESTFGEVHRRAAGLARRAAGLDRIVLGDLGPLGDFFPPMGTLTEAEAVDGYAERADALASSGLIDGFLIETQFDLSEVLCAIRGVRSVSDLPLAVTMSFDTHGRTMMGVSPRRFAEAASDLGVTILGANCGANVEDTWNAIREIRQTVPDAVLWAKPNAGLPRLVDGHECYELTPERFADEVSRFDALGIRVIGGCCGTTPEHIAAAAQALRH